VFRALGHYWRLHLAVVMGVAVATMVLSGALLVGDSVRGSLRDMILERLGNVHHVLLSTRMFRADTAGDLGGSTASASMILMPGSANHGERGTRASNVTILGVDPAFAQMFENGSLEFDRGDGQIFPSVVLNRSLARELQAEVGEAVLLRFEQVTEVRRDTLMGERDAGDLIGTLRGTVRQIVPDDGLGGFGVVASQKVPANAFVELEVLQRALDVGDGINTLAIGALSSDDPADQVGRLLTLDDLGVRLVIDSEGQRPQIRAESRDFVFRDDVERLIAGVAGEELTRVQSYLANSMRFADREVPYSMVVALDTTRDPSGSTLETTRGPVTDIGDDEVLLGRWAADDLGVAVGDTIEMDYFVVGPREELETETSRFTVAAIVEATGLANKRSLTPDYPGVQDADDMAAWDPPFPVELNRIRPQDEAYWDRHGATPKAFVSAATGRRLWGTHHGTTTAMLIGIPDGVEPASRVASLSNDLRAALDPYGQGFRFSDTRADGLDAARGATDFGQLFLAFSLFLIVSAALLIGLLFGLGVEQRSREVGLRAAVGFTNTDIRKMFLREGAALAGVGIVIGSGLAVGYAGLLMVALRTLWIGAVGSSRLFLHVQPLSLLIGGAIAIIVSLFTVWRTLARLKKASPSRLLGGGTPSPASPKRRRVARAATWILLLAGLALIAVGFVGGNTESAGLSFGAAALLLVAGIMGFNLWCRSDPRGTRGLRRGNVLAAMAARNSRWNPGRSVLSVALIASACFVIVTVAASRHHFGNELEDRDSASGGFSLVAESDVPIFEEIGDLDVTAFRSLPGDDASCLNLYRPGKPQVLGVPASMIERGGFTFQKQIQVEGDLENPWTLLEQDLGEDVIPAIVDINSAMWILKLGLGDELELEDQRGGTIRLRLVGMLQKSILQSQVLISEEAFRRHFPDQVGFRFFLIETPFDEATAVAASLEQELGDFGFDAKTSVETMEQFQAVEHTYLSTFQLLGALGLLLGTIGLAVVLLRNLVERRSELATMRACGYRRSRLARLVTLETAFLLVTGIVIGAGSAMLALSPRLAHLRAPWDEVAITLAVVCVVGLTAALLAARSVMRMPLIESLRSDR